MVVLYRRFYREIQNSGTDFDLYLMLFAGVPTANPIGPPDQLSQRAPAPSSPLACPSGCAARSTRSPGCAGRSSREPGRQAVLAAPPVSPVGRGGAVPLACHTSAHILANGLLSPLNLL